MPLKLKDCFQADRPVIGMIHAPALPGAPAFQGSRDAVRSAVLRDAEALVQGGVDALMLENFGDVPFYPDAVPQYVVAEMTALAVGIRAEFDLPLGINVLRNDGCAALAVAAAAGARFIRVNILCGARLTDQGIVQGIAHELLRLRSTLQALDVKILADVDVKHSAPLGVRAIEEEAEETLHRGGADALIVSGSGTGKKTDPTLVTRIKTVVAAPVLIGSGVTVETARQYRDLADGFIVGTSAKRDGIVTAPVDPDRVRAIVEQVR